MNQPCYGDVELRNDADPAVPRVADHVLHVLLRVEPRMDARQRRRELGEDLALRSGSSAWGRPCPTLWQLSLGKTLLYALAAQLGEVIALRSGSSAWGRPCATPWQLSLGKTLLYALAAQPIHSICLSGHPLDCQDRELRSTPKRHMSDAWRWSTLSLFAAIVSSRLRTSAKGAATPLLPPHLRLAALPCRADKREDFTSDAQREMRAPGSEAAGAHRGGGGPRPSQRHREEAPPRVDHQRSYAARRRPPRPTGWRGDGMRRLLGEGTPGYPALRSLRPNLQTPVRGVAGSPPPATWGAIPECQCMEKIPNDLMCGRGKCAAKCGESVRWGLKRRVLCPRSRAVRATGTRGRRAR
eukprot:gene8244-biopygen1197